MVEVLCIDLEASGLGPSSFPIEVAVATVNGDAVRSWLIQPAPLWLERGMWDDDAEALHTIPLAHLLAAGLPPASIVDELNGLLWGALVLSDNAHHDRVWLRALYAAAGANNPPCEIQSFQTHAQDLAARYAAPAQAMKEAEASAWAAIPERHRAAPDARRNAHILHLLSGGSLASGGIRAI